MYLILRQAGSQRMFRLFEWEVTTSLLKKDSEFRFCATVMRKYTYSKQVRFPVFLPGRSMAKFR